MTFIKTKIGSRRTNPAFLNNLILNTKVPTLLEFIANCENDYLKIEKDLLIFRPVVEFLPDYFLESENLKRVTFESDSVTERESNNHILRNFLRLHELIEFEIRGYKDKNEDVYNSIVFMLHEKKTTFDNLVDMFYKK